MSDEKLIEAIETLKEYCDDVTCDDCVFNRAKQEGCYDCMITNTSPLIWEIPDNLGGADHDN